MHPSVLSHTPSTGREDIISHVIKSPTPLSWLESLIFELCAYYVSWVLSAWNAPSIIGKIFSILTKPVSHFIHYKGSQGHDYNTYCTIRQQLC